MVMAARGAGEATPGLGGRRGDGGGRVRRRAARGRPHVAGVWRRPSGHGGRGRREVAGKVGVGAPLVVAVGCGGARHGKGVAWGREGAGKAGAGGAALADGWGRARVGRGGGGARANGERNARWGEWGNTSYFLSSRD